MKRIFRILLPVCIAAILLELGLRVLLYQHKAKEPLAILEAYHDLKLRVHTPNPTYLYKGYFLARPDSGEEINKKIAQEEYMGNRFEYSPWIDYRNIDTRGKYLNVNGLVRASIPDEFMDSGARVGGGSGSLAGPGGSAALAVPVTIYFLGGSTMFGVNATDRETIPSAFVNLYRSRYPHGKPIRIANYGMCASYSYSELMLLSHLIYSGKKPDIVIVMDGLNNFLMVKAAENRWPYYYYHLKAAGKDDIDFRELYSINDSTLSYFTLPSGPAAKETGDRLLGNYLSDMDNMRKLALANGVTPYFFVQPVPFYHYPNRKNDPICDTAQNEIIEKAYGVLEKKADSTGNCFFLGNLLQDRKGYPFIDRYHYSPAMSVEIARSILDVAGKKINGY